MANLRETLQDILSAASYGIANGDPDGAQKSIGDALRLLAAAPEPDRSAGVGGMVASTLHIPRSESLDPIYCYFEDFDAGRGRLTIACFGDAWTGAWGGMGDRTVRQFVAGRDPDYLASSLLELRSENKRMRDYTTRIAAAVIAALTQPADADADGAK